jgi:hypothetical protein
MRTQSLIYTTIIAYLFVTVAVACKCNKTPTPPACDSNHYWNGATCVVDSTKVWNGSTFTNLGTSINGIPSVHLAIGNNCGDWRDSLYIGSDGINKNEGSIWLNQLPSAGMTWAGSGLADISYYETGAVIDSFAVMYGYMQNHRPEIRPDRGYAMFATVNKAKDTIWARVYNANGFVGPYQLYDYCDKILVKVK